MTLQIKKYANRRLYNTEMHGYINLSEVEDAINSGRDIQVTSEVTGKDMTAQMLLEIMVKQAKEGRFDGLSIADLHLLARCLYPGAA